MTSVFISKVAIALPEHRLSQTEAAHLIGQATGEPRRAAAIARGSAIATRALAVGTETVAELGSVEARNRIYERLAPCLALQAGRSALAGHAPDGVGVLVSTSCTGYMVPSWDVAVARGLELPATVTRLPITEAGCAGGVVALARAADYLRLHPGSSGLAMAVELCSLAFHADASDGNLTSSLLFGDAAAAVVLDTDPADRGGLEIVDSLSLLVPSAKEVLGFDLTDSGLYPLLSRDLPELLREPAAQALAMLLKRNGLGGQAPPFLLLHPGGPRILEVLQREFGVDDDALRWSWASLAQSGNTSSAAIFDVIRRFQDDCAAPAGWGVVMAFGPGISIELLLVRRTSCAR